MASSCILSERDDIPAERDDALKGLVEQGLAASVAGLWLQFPQALEARFEADTRRARSRFLAGFSLLSSCVMLLLYPTLLSEVPDIRVQASWWYLGGCIPLCTACSALMLANPHPRLREAAISFVTATLALVIMSLFLKSQSDDMSILVSVVFLLIVYSAVGMQLRFEYAVAVIGFIVAVYVVGLRGVFGLAFSTRTDLSLLVTCGGAYSLIANWRQEAQARRFYLMSLREQLQGRDLERHNQALDELSKSDSLTGLANRRAYDLWLAQEWSRAEKTGGDLGLIILDIDKFKAYNDFYGHAGGDGCLQAIARCLGEQIRGPSDLVARLGGEEFAVLMPGLGDEASADVAERLRLAVERLELPHLGIGRAGLVTVSAGVATRLGGAATPERLFEAADAALYGAKRSGRNRVCVSSGEGEVVEERRKVG